MSKLKGLNIQQLAKFQLSKKQALVIKGGNEGEATEDTDIIISDDILD